MTCWSENNDYTHFTRGKKSRKMLWQRQILFRCMPFVWIPLWLHRIQASAGFSSAKHHQSPFVLSSSATFSWALFALCPLACYLCFLFSARQSFHQDLHNLRANTELQGEKEAVTNYLTIHVKHGVIFKGQYIQSKDYTEVILYGNTTYRIRSKVASSFISHRKEFLYIQPTPDFSTF